MPSGTHTGRQEAAQPGGHLLKRSQVSRQTVSMGRLTANTDGMGLGTLSHDLSLVIRPLGRHGCHLWCCGLNVPGSPDCGTAQFSYLRPWGLGPWAVGV